MKVQKPWGNYQTIWVEAGFQVKRIHVNPKCRLSLQKHCRRAEKWTVVLGAGTAVIDGKELQVAPGSVIAIPIGTVHRMWNTGDSPLIFIEVQLGEYLGEDDITRIEDDYHRA